MAEVLRIQELVDARGSSLHLELLTPNVTLEGVCSDPDLAESGVGGGGVRGTLPGWANSGVWTDRDDVSVDPVA